MFSIGFISYTISVVKAVLEANPEIVEAANNEAINSSSPNSSGDPIANLDESQYAEIVSQTTNKVVQQLLESESQAVKEIISDQISAMIIDEKAADLQSAAVSNSETVETAPALPIIKKPEIAEPKTAKKEPIIEYEDVVITDYYLRYYYGSEDYTNLRQKLNWVDKDLKSDNEVNLKQKYQENLLRDKQEVLKWDEIRADMLKKARNY